MTARNAAPRSRKNASENETAGDDLFQQRKRAVEARFRVQVDRQTKSSHETHALAAAAAVQIKDSHPVVQVSIHDAEEGQTTLVEGSTPS
jgi:hypothetical protein